MCRAVCICMANHVCMAMYVCMCACVYVCVCRFIWKSMKQDLIYPYTWVHDNLAWQARRVNPAGLGLVYFTQQGHSSRTQMLSSTKPTSGNAANRGRLNIEFIPSDLFPHAILV